MRAQIGGEGGTHGTEYRGWRFSAAPGTLITDWKAHVCARAFAWGSSVYLESVDGDNRPSSWSRSWDMTPPTYGCGSAAPYWNSAGNAVGGGTARQLTFGAACPLGACPEVSGVVARAEVAAFWAEIRDDSPPVLVAMRGPTLTGPRSSRERFVFDATDVGVGLYRAVAEIKLSGAGDWTEIAGTRIGTAETCEPIRETGYRYEFISPQPCPLDVQAAELTVDASAVPVGVHALRLTLEDAAGNVTTLMPAQTYEVSDPAATQGTSATTNLATSPLPAPDLATHRSAGARPTPKLSLAGRTTRVVSRERPIEISGRVRDGAGNPIPRAVVSLRSRSFLPKARKSEGEWVAAGTATANDAGVFRVRLPRGPSRTVLVSYKHDPADAVPAASDLANLIVPANVTARAVRPQVRNGSQMVIAGRVAGPIPSGGVLVNLEARDGRRWVPVATTRRSVKTSSTGRFKLSYRFRSTFHAVTYRFRVVVDEDSDFPYSRGASRLVKVRVAP